jgi:hypothetical protein
MKVLLDECVDRNFRRDIVGHEVLTAQQMGWTSIRNGELLALAASSGFGAFVSTDRGLAYQHRISSVGLAIFILRAPRNDRVHLRPLVSKLLAALAVAAPGTATFIDC